MTVWRARIGLLVVFILSWALNSLMLFHFRSVMEGAQRNELFAALAKIHSVPIGIVAGGIFASVKPKKVRVPIGVAWISLFLSVAWSLLIAEAWASYPSVDYVAADLIQELGRRASEVSFLLAGVLAYFSTKVAQD